MKKLLHFIFILLCSVKLIAQTPVAYYPFNGNANDAAGSLNGTINGATLTSDRFGIVNRAYSFNGTSDFISTSNLAVTGADNWTMIAWMKPASINQIGSIVMNGFDDGSSGNGYSMIIADGGGSSGNKLTGLFCGVSFYNPNLPALSTSLWYHVAMVRNGGITTCYLNGIAGAVTSSSPVNNPAGTLRIGGQNGVRFFNGAIDEVKIFNVPLSASQIRADYASSNQIQKPGSGNTISFDGIDDFVNASTTGYTGIQTYTIECWIKKNASNLTNHVWESNGGSAPSLESNGNIDLNFWVGNTSPISTGPLNIGQWYHVACVYDKLNTLQSLYVNGIRQGSAIINVSDAIGADIGFMRRSFFGGPSRNFAGELDEVRIWNTALTQSQIRDRMCKKITNLDPLYNNLVAYYNFDESTGATLFDGSVNGNNGTLFNGPTRVPSAAAIGNNSAHNYVTTGFPSANISFPGQDNFAVAYTAGTFTGEAGTQVYLVTEKPNTENGIAGVGANNRYFGVFNCNLTAPQYTATYNYTGNPFVNSSNQSTLALFKRPDNAGAVWINSGATLNTTAHTLIAPGQNTEYILGSTGSALPLNLLKFGANKVDDIVKLQWSTTNEINASHFIIERSGNGTNFQSIGRVIAKGNLLLNEYSLQDIAPAKGINFYRLLKVDNDGKFAYSQIIQVLFRLYVGIIIYPNPAKENINISLAETGEKWIGGLYSADGKLLQSIMIASPADATIPVHNLTRGKYVLRLGNGKVQQTATFIKE